MPPPSRCWSFDEPEVKSAFRATFSFDSSTLSMWNNMVSWLANIIHTIPIRLTFQTWPFHVGNHPPPDPEIVTAFPSVVMLCIEGEYNTQPLLQHISQPAVGTSAVIWPNLHTLDLTRMAEEPGEQAKLDEGFLDSLEHRLDHLEGVADDRQVQFTVMGTSKAARELR